MLTKNQKMRAANIQKLLQELNDLGQDYCILNDEEIVDQALENFQKDMEGEVRVAKSKLAHEY